MLSLIPAVRRRVARYAGPPGLSRFTRSTPLHVERALPHLIVPGYGLARTTAPHATGKEGTAVLPRSLRPAQIWCQVLHWPCVDGRPSPVHGPCAGALPRRR